MPSTSDYFELKEDRSEPKHRFELNLRFELNYRFELKDRLELKNGVTANASLIDPAPEEKRQGC